MAAQLNKQAIAQGREAFQFKSVPQGAATSVWAGVVADADEIGGKYCENCQVGQLTDSAALDTSAGVRPYALDADHAKALWAKSEGWTGERF